jgi:lipopolysaccharide export system permease protein
MLDTTGRISARINANSGRYNGTYWVLQDATLYLLDVDGKVVESSRQSEYHNERLSMEPGMFRNLSADIRTMELGIALQYVSRLKTIDSRQHAVFASDLYNRIFNSFTPLILIIISCSTILNWKKNVLVFSIIASLSIAIVFYVMQMLSMILAKQGVIHPIMGPLLPMVVLLVFSIISSTVIRK